MLMTYVNNICYYISNDFIERCENSYILTFLNLEINICILSKEKRFFEIQTTSCTSKCTQGWIKQYKHLKPYYN